MMNDVLLEVVDLKKHFREKNGVLKAVDGISFHIKRGETLGLVGESGSGKTTTGRLILRLIEPTAGRIVFEGQDLSNLKKHEMRLVRRNIQMIFQDPYASLNPRMTVREIIAEPLIIHKVASGKELEERVNNLLDIVGLHKNHAKRLPQEFSGGQRQRIGIARALALEPKLIVCDEPISALDVSIQAQIINLLQDLQEQFNLTYLFIAHDLSVVKHIADRVAVMYLGKIVEMGDKEQIFNEPRHPYTKALLASVPIPDPSQKGKAAVLKGDSPSPINPPPGCRFASLCEKAKDICFKEEPDLVEVKSNHFVGCHPDSIAND